MLLNFMTFIYFENYDFYLLDDSYPLKMKLILELSLIFLTHLYFINLSTFFYQNGFSEELQINQMILYVSTTLYVTVQLTVIKW